MADNTILNTGSGGDTLATDDISGIKYPRSKIVIGADGTNDGDVSSANPLPVKGTGTAGTANAGVVTVQGIASMTAIQVADNGGALTVDNGGTFVVQIDGTALSRLTDIETNTDSGAVVGNGAAATAQRVTLANDSTGIVALTTSTASIGKLAANSGVDIGDVDVLTINGVAPAFGTGLRGATVQRVTIATDDVVPASQSGTWTVQPGNTANTTAWLVTGTGGTFPITDSNGSLTVDAPVGTPVFVRLSDGASAITTLPVSLASVPSHAVTNAGTFAVQPTPATSGGLTMHTAVSAATNNATSVKASAGQVFGLQLMNKNASPRYFKLYNKATAPSPGSDTPVKTLMVPGNTAGSGMVLSWTMGLAFSTGIAYAVVAGIGTTDNTSIGAEDVAINMDYA